jgi:anthranilate synthase component 2
MKILVIDNYDSFTFNLVHILEKLGAETMAVYRNDKIDLAEVAQYDKIVLSPGPGLPSDSHILKDIIQQYGSTKSILGVCLGHQAIAEAYGGSLKNLERVFHGVKTKISLSCEGDYLFSGMPGSFECGRYHSWVVNSGDFPTELEVTAIDGNGEVMALAHKEYDIRGVQWHPEYILTDRGEQLLENWLNNN